jgi:CDP-paratose 2-epimerase
VTDRTLITGGAGFVGANMADRLLEAGGEVVVLDDLSRTGVRENLALLCERHPRRLEVVEGDVRDADCVRTSLRGADRVFHFAAQVAVTTSVEDPARDFSINLAGTLNVLEELRRSACPPPLLFTSTNKVYGDLADIGTTMTGVRYEPVAESLRLGIAEDRPLSFCSPYGCSKGGADQYVLDYAKSYDLPTIVFRMSCIYGPYQQGNEDQGWVAHFARRALHDEVITIFGDGRQVRDVLFVDDLIDAMLLASEAVGRLKGQAFNIGGGVRNAVSLLEVLDMIGDLTGRAPKVAFGPRRIGDQSWYVSDTGRFERATGWTPEVPVAKGLEQLHAWLCWCDESAGVLEG